MAEVADLVGLAELPDLVGPAELPHPEDAADSADPADREDPEDRADSAGPEDLAQLGPRPMKFCVTRLAIVTTPSSSASVTRPTIPVSQGRI